MAVTTSGEAGRPGREVVDEALLAEVARRCYLEDQSKVDVAKALGISRFKVARLLDLARSTGVVTIHVRVPSGEDVGLSHELGRALGLDRCVVVRAAASGSTAAADSPVLEARSAVAAAAASLLPQLVHDGDRLGLAWSRAVDVMVERLDRLPRCTVVQLVGTLHDTPGATNTVDLVRRAAQLAGGVSHPVNAPLLLDSPEAAASLRRQPGIRDTLALADALDVAVVAVGAWRRGCSTVWAAVDEDVREQVRRAGGVAEVSGRVLGADGEPVSTVLDDMVVGATAAQLQGARHRLALVAGPHRAEAVLAAVRGGFVSSLVTTTEVAQDVLRLPGLPGPA